MKRITTAIGTARRTYSMKRIGNAIAMIVAISVPMLVLRVGGNQFVGGTVSVTLVINSNATKVPATNMKNGAANLAFPMLMTYRMAYI